MPSRTDFDIQVAGLKELIAGFEQLQDRNTLRSVIGGSLAESGRATVVPAIKRQMSADFKRKGSHRNPRGVENGRGQGGPAEKNVTARRARLRSGELVAINFGPRAWWSHFPIGGTKAHSLAAKRDGRSRFSVLPFMADAAAGRRARRGMGLRLSHRGTAAPGWGTWESRTSALGGIRISGAAGASSVRGSVRANAGLHSPGTRGTDSVHKAVQGVVPALNARYVADLQKAYDKYLTKPTRSARPRKPG